jgi:type IV secretory pathway VirB10-like protein
LSPAARLGSFGVVIVALVVGATAWLVREKEPRERPNGAEEASSSAREPQPPQVSAREPAAPVPAPADAGRAQVAANAAANAVPVDLEKASEEVLMQRAKDALSHAPAEALRIIEIADRRFGLEHEQRRVLEIESLVGLQRIGESHAKAERFYRYYPNSPEGERLERLTGSHPRPWGPNSGVR